MADTSKTIQKWYIERLRDFFVERYRGYLNNEETESQENELGKSATYVPREKHDTVPEEVRAAHAYYAKHFGETDLGSARVWRFTADRKTYYAIRVTTDGDDGFLEIYDKKGSFLAASRRYLEVAAWGSRDWLREQAPHPWDLPPELKDASSETLWGGPLVGFHCMKTTKHPCNHKPAGCCIEPAGHIEKDNSPHRCSRCGYTWGGIPKPPEPPPPPKPEIVPWIVKVYGTEASPYSYKVIDTEITIDTKAGKVTVPVVDIQQIDFAARTAKAKRAAKPRKSDVIRTKDAKYAGKIKAKALRTMNPWGEGQIQLADMKRLCAMTVKEIEEENTFNPPETLVSQSNSAGKQIRYRITGRHDGRVIGTDTYSTESYIETAAVHAGMLKLDEKGVLIVEILPPQKKYKGSTRNGVTSESQGETLFGAFRFLSRAY